MKEVMGTMNEVKEIWCITNSDDEGCTTELYSTYEKAKEAFDELVTEINFAYGEAGEEIVEVELSGDYASYDAGSHYGNFYIESKIIH